ncbi:MAG: hypothetical protein RSG22_06900 [Comamonas sp.]
MTHLFFIDNIKRINNLMLLLGLLILPFQATAQFYEDPGSGVRVIRQTFLTTRSTVVTVSTPISLNAFSVRVARDLVGVDDFGLRFFVYDNGLDNGDYSVVADDPAGKLLYQTDVASFTSNSNSDFQWRKSPDFTMPVNLLPGRKYLLGILPDKNINSIHRLSSYT